MREHINAAPNDGTCLEHISMKMVYQTLTRVGY